MRRPGEAGLGAPACRLKIEVLHIQILLCSVMDMTGDIVDRALRTYEFKRDDSQLANSRERIERYIGKLMAAKKIRIA
jgi:hypothetical protein